MLRRCPMLRQPLQSFSTLGAAGCSQPAAAASGRVNSRAAALSSLISAHSSATSACERGPHPAKAREILFPPALAYTAKGLCGFHSSITAKTRKHRDQSRGHGRRHHHAYSCSCSRDHAGPGRPRSSSGWRSRAAAIQQRLLARPRRQVFLLGNRLSDVQLLPSRCVSHWQRQGHRDGTASTPRMCIPREGVRSEV